MAIQKTEQEWKQELSPEDFHILREKVLSLHLQGFIGIIMPQGFIVAKHAMSSCLNLPVNTIQAVVGRALLVRLMSMLLMSTKT